MSKDNPSCSQTALLRIPFGTLGPFQVAQQTEDVCLESVGSYGDAGVPG